MANPYYSPDFKWKVVQEYKKEGRILAKMTRKYGVHHSSIKEWERIVNKYGKIGLEQRRRQKTYSKKLKQAAIKDYLSGNYSLREVTYKHNISSPSVLRKWIKDYNRHRELKKRAEERGISMTNKRRKTTQEQRIEIVKAALENEKDYQLTAELYGVSYQQVYQWVRKYEKDGWDGLQDRRGKPKPESALTTEEKLKRQLREKDNDILRLQAEVDFLKKLEVMERRGTKQ